MKKSLKAKLNNGLSLSKMKAEVFFLKYAFPCTFIIKERGQIDERTFNLLRDAAISSKTLDRLLLEKVYFRAFEKIKMVSEEMKKDKWDLEVLKEYFLKRHNVIIDNGMFAYKNAPASQKRLCKIHKARIAEDKGDCFIVQYKENNKKGKRAVLKELVPDAKTGDTVTIHYGYAVEKIS